MKPFTHMCGVQKPGLVVGGEGEGVGGVGGGN